MEPSRAKLIKAQRSCQQLSYNSKCVPSLSKVSSVLRKYIVTAVNNCHQLSQKYTLEFCESATNLYVYTILAVLVKGWQLLKYINRCQVFEKLFLIILLGSKFICVLNFNFDTWVYDTFLVGWTGGQMAGVQRMNNNAQIRLCSELSKKYTHKMSNNLKVMKLFKLTC